MATYTTDLHSNAQNVTAPNKDIENHMTKHIIEQSEQKAWLDEIRTDWDFNSLTPLENDASFRCYFRMQTKNGDSFIIMNSPPDKENNSHFAQTANYFYSQGINVPQLIAQNSEHGYFLLTDFGDTTVLKHLNQHKGDQPIANATYRLALKTLTHIQRCQPQPACPLPHYDRQALTYELNLFKTWFLEKHLGHRLNHNDEKQLGQINHLLIESALSQPQVCVHRDYHSRNLMWLTEDKLGVLDFQDAVWGPITYDAVSLLCDAYIQWPASVVHEHLIFFYDCLQKKNLGKHDNTFDTFVRWFDWMGIQRHLKIIGIFARLYWRDGKTHYLKHLPALRHYIMQASQPYKELQWLHNLLQAI